MTPEKSAFVRTNSCVASEAVIVAVRGVSYIRATSPKKSPSFSMQTTDPLTDHGEVPHATRSTSHHHLRLRGSPFGPS